MWYFFLQKIEKISILATPILYIENEYLFFVSCSAILSTPGQKTMLPHGAFRPPDKDVTSTPISKGVQKNCPTFLSGNITKIISLDYLFFLS